MPGYAAEREVRQNSKRINAMARRLDRMDVEGTRSVTALTVQFTEIVKDMTEIRGQLASHEKTHEHERTERIKGRRWIISIGLAGIASMATIIGMLVAVLGQIH